MGYIPLHVHSQYSILDSTASIPGLVKTAKNFKMPALALTDFCNLFGAIEFVKACMSENIKPIIGIELMLAPLSRFEKKKTPGIPYGYPLTLLAKNRAGYKNLCKLSSLAYLEGFYYTPRIDKELLSKFKDDLICLSGPIQGKIGKCIRYEEGKLDEEIDFFLSTFGEDFFFEIQNHSMSEQQLSLDGIDKEQWLYRNYLDFVATQKMVNEKLLVLSKERSIPCVATGDVHYLHREDWRAHEILMNIQSGEPCEILERDAHGRTKGRSLNPKRQVMPSHEFYFKSYEEMQQLFIPSQLEKTFEIAEKCDLKIDFNTRYYPVFVPPSLEGKSFTDKQRSKEAEKYLRELCEEGISKRYTKDRLEKVREKYPGQSPDDVVRKRLEYELEVITSKGMCDYLLIVHDFISWAKNRQIPVGPGRGSGAGSIILYLIGVTDIEPLQFNLFFERFINPERISYPDIDVDICMERRHEVIDYTIKKYGKEKVAQIITFGTMKAKMAIKDVGRVLSVPLSKVNLIAKLVPEDPHMTLDKALEMDAELRALCETDEEAKRVIDLAKRVEGSIRNTGIHAAGLIICGDPLMEHIPICIAKDTDMVVTQFSMKPVEAVGMLKIDFLGLKTLTSIQKTIDAIQASKGIQIDWVNLPLDNPKAFSLLNQGKTLGVFQLESAGMQDLAKQIHIDRFEEIIAVGALYRPGPMEMIPSFIQRKQGKEPIEFDHPWMKEILEETYGIMVYQEQVMQIAHLLAGYSLGEGDVLRKAMGKKDKKEMGKQRKKFLAGAEEKGVNEEIAGAIFDKIEKFASYGFNKSHAAAYGFLSYVTAYLKANFSKEWLAASMTCDMDDISKVAKHIREAQSMGIAILPPSVNESEGDFIATEKGIRFALSGIKGVGKGVVEAILEERKQNGIFTSLSQFISRIDMKRIGKKVIETLIEAGSFDFMDLPRPFLMHEVEGLYEVVLRQQKEKEKGFLDFFSHVEETFPSKTSRPSQEKFPIQEILRREKELLGFYLTGHPMDAYKDILVKLSCFPLHEIEKLDGSAVIRCAFIIETVQVRFSKTGKKFAILTISDGMERFELPIWSEFYEKNAPILIENQLIYAVLHIERSREEIKLSCRWINDLTKVDEAMIKACDEAFDKAKAMIKLEQLREGNQKKMSKEVQKKISLLVNIETMRLSHIIEIKKLFQEFPGNHAVCLDFQIRGERAGLIEIHADWGVSGDEGLQKKLKQLPCYINHQIL